MIRIEAPSLSTLVSRTRRRPTTVALPSCFSLIRRKHSLSRTSLTWEEMRSVDARLEAEVWATAQRYGYQR